jgi:segregation and condensation protein A
VSLGQDYEVKLDLFEGPLDLLLYLVQKDEVDIAEISVAHVAKQYLAYLGLMRELNINVAADYLHMAATLVRIKAHEILPASDEALGTEEEGIYSKEQLIQQLLEYKKFKEAARSLRQYESSQSGSFTRGTVDEIEADQGVDADTIGDISVFDLLAAFRRVLEQADNEDPSHGVEIDSAKLDDRLEHVMRMVTDSKEVKFEDLFADDKRRIVIVVTFMALLELIKMQEIVFRQEENFRTIYVAHRDPSTREAVVDEVEDDDDEQDDEHE